MSFMKKVQGGGRKEEETYRCTSKKALKINKDSEDENSEEPSKAVEVDFADVEELQLE
jgi:hypothetical protein